MSASIEQQLLEALIELERKIKSFSTGPRTSGLLPIFSHIDELAGQLPPDADPELRHFLQRKSYEKARLFLEEHRTA